MKFFTLITVLLTLFTSHAAFAGQQKKLKINTDIKTLNDLYAGSKPSSQLNKPSSKSRIIYVHTSAATHGVDVNYSLEP